MSVIAPFPNPRDRRAMTAFDRRELQRHYWSELVDAVVESTQSFIEGLHVGALEVELGLRHG